MSLFRRYRWFISAAAITLAYSVVSLTAHKSFGLTAFGDFFGVLIMLVASGVMLANAISRPGMERSFWGLMAFAFSLWVVNQWGWAYNEVVLRRELPDPYFVDIILFFHVVPMIAAVAWRPDQVRTESRFHLSTLHFLMLLVWWLFLYAFIVFPHQYVILNVPAYNGYYDLLYEFENLLLLLVLAYAGWTSTGAWKRLYLNFLAAGSVYTAGSQVLDKAVFKGTYYTGSLYDVPLTDQRWKTILPQMAMLAILSLPVLGLWAFLEDTSPVPSRMFRLFTVLAAMLVLGAFAFLRQYIQDQALMHLLGESRAGFENQ